MTVIIATLGPHGTCSEGVLLEHLSRFPPGSIVRLLPSYDGVARAVEQGEAQYGLIAAAYPFLNHLVFGPQRRLRMVDCFIADTLELVLAARAPDVVPATVACAAAPLPTVRAAFPDARIIPANSNADAAALVQRGEADAAFTTLPAATAGRLAVMRSYGSIAMTWIVFSRLDEPAAGGAPQR